MISESELPCLVAQGETQTVELKRSLSQSREGLKSLCAMVNADCARGTVVFGIAPDRTPCGIEPGDLDKAQRSLSRAVTTSFDPQLAVEMQVAELAGKRVLLLSAKRSRAVPLHEYDGRAWIRQGTEDVRLTVAQRKGRAAALEPPGEAWGETFRVEAPRGDCMNSDKKWVLLRMVRPWRVTYGAEAKAAAEKGHFTVRVYPREAGAGLTEAEPHEIAQLGAGAFKLRKRSKTFKETGHFLLQVDAQTVWYAVTVEEQE